MIVFNYTFHWFIDRLIPPFDVNFSDSLNRQKLFLCGKILADGKKAKRKDLNHPYANRKTFDCEISTSVGSVSGFLTEQRSVGERKSIKTFKSYFRSARMEGKKIERFNCGFLHQPQQHEIIFSSYEILWIMSIKFYGVRV